MTTGKTGSFNLVRFYTRDELLERIAIGDQFNYLLFYGHTKGTKESVNSTCLSQWYPAPFEVDGVQYPTAEHYFMAEKARLFGDAESLEKILQSKSPRDAKALGRQVGNFDPVVWGQNCFEIVVRANAAKFSQNDDLRKWLLATAPKILVEASPTDKIWGIGLAKSDARANDPSQWQGQNLLGFALMKVRDDHL